MLILFQVSDLEVAERVVSKLQGRRMHSSFIIERSTMTLRAKELITEVTHKTMYDFAAASKSVLTILYRNVRFIVLQATVLAAYPVLPFIHTTHAFLRPE